MGTASGWSDLGGGRRGVGLGRATYLDAIAMT